MKSKIILILAIFLILVNIAGAQNPVAAFGENLRSGALANSIGELFRNTLLLPYTTVAGELNPQYEITRRGIDGILFFIIFFLVVQNAIDKMWKDMEKKQRRILSLAIGAALTIGLLASGFSLGKVVPYGINIAMAGLAVLFVFLLQMPRNKDNKPYIGFVPALLIAVLLSWLIVNAFNLAGGQGTTFAGGLFGTERKSDFAARLVISEGEVSANPDENYKLGLAAVQNYQYDRAKDYFSAVIDYGPSNNKYYFDAVKWLSKKDGDKLFKHMVEHYPPIMNAERAVAEALIDKAREMSTTDPNRINVLNKAEKYLRDVKNKESLLEKEYAKRITA